jgi:hypothetical protein
METRGYILHRLTTAGWTGRPAWDDAAFAAVFARCGGLPRRINRLCGRVLGDAALEKVETITAAMVEATAAELAGDLQDAAPHLNGAPDHTDALSGLRMRVRALEQQVASQDRMLRRLLAAGENGA